MKAAMPATPTDSARRRLLSRGAFAAVVAVAALAAAVLPAGGAVAAGAQELPLRFDPGRDAAKDVAAAVALAAESGRHVLVDVGGEWCSWCHVMDRFFDGNAELTKLRDRNYVWVKVNWSKENPNDALLSRWPKVRGYPHLFVLDAGGRLLHSQDTGELEAGKSYDVAKFTAFLTRYAPSR
jgi:thiol:disulfide interchange protein